MSPLSPVHERFYRVLTDVAEQLKLRGPDPALELAGRFGLRRYAERHVTGETDFRPSLWLEQGARLRKEARVLSRALTDAGVKHCFFKGIAVMGRFYRIDERWLADVDLLIDPSDRTAAVAALYARGYAELSDAAVWVPAMQRPGVTMQRAARTSGEEDLLLDLHWGLESVATLLPETQITLPSAVWPSIESQRGLPVLSDEQHAALVLHHLVRHDLLHVRGLLDFALLWEALPHEGGRELSRLARELGIGRALGLVARVLVDELLVFPLRGVRLGPWDWRGRVGLRQMRLRDWLAWAARHAARSPRHVTVTRSRAWRRFLLADAARGGRLLSEVVVPPGDYLRWRWPAARSHTAAWVRHLLRALRS